MIDGEFSDGQLHVYFHAQSPQAHEVVHDLAEPGTVVEETELQHHLFGIEADAFIRAGIVVTAPNLVFMRPRQRHLKVMSGHALVHNQRPRIFGNRQREVIKIRRRLFYIADAVFIKPGVGSEIVSHTHE